MRIAIIEDDPASAMILGRAFSQSGASTETYHNGRQFLRHASRQKFDLAVLDLRLPDMTGIQVLARLKLLAQTCHQPLPVMVVTGCAENAVMAAAFDEGAADYVLKPFEPQALLIRAKSLVRRTQPVIFNEDPIRVGPIVLNLATRQSLVHGQEVHLSDKEFRLAWMLFLRQGKPVSRAQLHQVIWGQADRPGHSRSLDTLIGRLRTKLGLFAPAGIRLLAVYGVGYRLDVFS